jgi:uncharacterized protein YjiS (DUF1127 family)
MNYQASSQSSQRPIHRPGTDAIDVLGNLFAAPFVWLERMRDRRRIADLDDHMLRDIGLSRTQAEDLASTPFWRR